MLIFWPVQLKLASHNGWDTHVGKKNLPVKYIWLHTRVTHWMTDECVDVVEHIKMMSYACVTTWKKHFIILRSRTHRGSENMRLRSVGVPLDRSQIPLTVMSNFTRHFGRRLQIHHVQEVTAGGRHHHHHQHRETAADIWSLAFDIAVFTTKPFIKTSVKGGTWGTWKKKMLSVFYFLSKQSFKSFFKSIF